MSYVYDRVGRDEYSHQTPHYGFVQGDGDFVFDTAVLDRLRASAPNEGTSGGEGVDILVNPSGVVADQMDNQSSLVEQLNDLLSDPSKRIKLDAFVSLHVVDS